MVCKDSYFVSNALEYRNFKILEVWESVAVTDDRTPESGNRCSLQTLQSLVMYFIDRNLPHIVRCWCLSYFYPQHGHMRSTCCTRIFACKIVISSRTIVLKRRQSLIKWSVCDAYRKWKLEIKLKCTDGDKRQFVKNAEVVFAEALYILWSVALEASSRSDVITSPDIRDHLNWAVLVSTSDVLKNIFMRYQMRWLYPTL